MTPFARGMRAGHPQSVISHAVFTSEERCIQVNISKCEQRVLHALADGGTRQSTTLRGPTAGASSTGAIRPRAGSWRWIASPALRLPARQALRTGLLVAVGLQDGRLPAPQAPAAHRQPKRRPLRILDPPTFNPWERALTIRSPRTRCRLRPALSYKR